MTRSVSGAKSTLVCAFLCMVCIFASNTATQAVENSSETNSHEISRNNSRKTSPEISMRTKIAVLRFAGPVVTDIDADEVWKMKNSTSAPTAGELSSLNDSLQDKLTKSLQERLGETVLPIEQVKRAQAELPPTVESGSGSGQLADKLAIKYFVSGVVERLEFDGNTLLPDIYSFTIRAKMVDSESGKEVWTFGPKKFTSKTYTKKSGKSVAEVFSDMKVPDATVLLASKIAAALGR